MRTPPTRILALYTPLAVMGIFLANTRGVKMLVFGKGVMEKLDKEASLCPSWSIFVFVIMNCPFLISYFHPLLAFLCAYLHLPPSLMHPTPVTPTVLSRIFRPPPPLDVELRDLAKFHFVIVRHSSVQNKITEKDHPMRPISMRHLSPFMSILFILLRFLWPYLQCMYIIITQFYNR